MEKSYENQPLNALQEKFTLKLLYINANKTFIMQFSNIEKEKITVHNKFSMFY